MTAARKYRRSRFRENRSPKAERQNQPYYVDDAATGIVYGVRYQWVEVGEPKRIHLPGGGYRVDYPPRVRRWILYVWKPDARAGYRPPERIEDVNEADPFSPRAGGA